MSEALLDTRVQTVLDLYNIEYNVIACDSKLSDTVEFCEAYGYSLDQSANTIIVMSRKIDPPMYAACVVVASSRLDVNKGVVKALGIKRASFADAETTKSITGMEIGGVVAVGITDLPVLVDSQVMLVDSIILGGGNRTSKLQLKPSELLKLPNVQVVEGLALLTN